MARATLPCVLDLLSGTLGAAPRQEPQGFLPTADCSGAGVGPNSFPERSGPSFSPPPPGTTQRLWGCSPWQAGHWETPNLWGKHGCLL